ncbi:hypothetical protein EGM70_12985 [Enterobacteriaceae bacterium 89]|nr:hypothetical protein [Enterobacteriaceae bacterium 89]
MYQQTVKPEENKIRATACPVKQMKNNRKQGFYFLDNRLSTVAQPKAAIDTNSSLLQLKTIIQRDAYKDNLKVQELKPKVDEVEVHITNNTAVTLPYGELTSYIDVVSESVKLRSRIDLANGDSGHVYRTNIEKGFLTVLEGEKTKRDHVAAEKSKAAAAAKVQSQAEANGVVGTPGFTPGKGWNSPNAPK